MELGKLIRAARHAKGLTQAELGKRFGISKAAVAMWEAGTNMPDPRKFAELVRVLGLNPLAALGGMTSRPTPGRIGMTDVVHRVQQYTEMIEAGDPIPSSLRVMIAADLREAVTEIERLRELLTKLEKDGG